MAQSKDARRRARKLKAAERIHAQAVRDAAYCWTRIYGTDAPANISEYVTTLWDGTVCADAARMMRETNS